MINLLPERLRVSVEEMKLYYPSLQFDGRQIITGGETFWKGWVQPILDFENLEWILDDIDQNQTIRVKNGEVSHHPDCRRTHQTFPWIKQIKKPDQAFKIKIAYDGGRRHPRGYVLQPVIFKTEQKHMFGDGAVCAYPPQENVWDWQTHTVANFTDQILIWLIKWNVWKQTQYWIGDETFHSKISLYFLINASEQCWCGSGTDYGICHRSNDRIEVVKEIFPLVNKSKMNF